MRLSKYAAEFDRMKDLLIELATEKNDRGALKYSAPVIMKKIGHAGDAAAIDNFNRWLNRQGIYRKPRTVKETPAPPAPPTPPTEELFPSRHLPDENIAIAFGLLYQRLELLKEAIDNAAEAVGLPTNE